MTVVTRFAPSPTGFLHIGGARTALFNWLYARHHDGEFRLRVEDTDRKRSTEEAKAAILDGLTWLGLDWDGDAVFQSTRAARHVEVARQMLAAGNAYHCYCSPEELAEMREIAKREGRRALYDGRWRDRDASQAPAGVDPVLRLKAPRDGETVIEDGVQGAVRVENAQLDDMVLLRADGTPTYMLAVVVDDHDMGVTHVIRGDDHLNNAFRQYQIYRALGWEPPVFAHIPLIHGADGAKLSKRHGALGVDAYRDMGMLPEAMRNYLLRLGWSHGDDEVISTKQAIEWFDLDGVGRSPARFDLAKLTNLNAHYLREMDDAALAEAIAPRLEAALDGPIGDAGRARLLAGLAGLKPRAETLVDLAEGALFYVRKAPLPMTEQAAKLLDDDGKAIIERALPYLEALADWDEAQIETTLRDFVEASDPPIKFGQVAQPVRAAVTGSATSPGLFEVLAVLGKEETLDRLGKGVNSDRPRGPV
ncbi:MAG: glutamate--tRNA ligase [Alphaproteobacteria bacterium]|nr:glutamate--tRNA ligase [Alphaproteobacteria bacterium]